MTKALKQIDENKWEEDARKAFLDKDKWEHVSQQFVKRDLRIGATIQIWNVEDGFQAVLLTQYGQRLSCSPTVESQAAAMERALECLPWFVLLSVLDVSREEQEPATVSMPS